MTDNLTEKKPIEMLASETRDAYERFKLLELEETDAEKRIAEALKVLENTLRAQYGNLWDRVVDAEEKYQTKLSEFKAAGEQLRRDGSPATLADGVLVVKKTEKAIVVDKEKAIAWAMEKAPQYVVKPAPELHKDFIAHAAKGALNDAVNAGIVQIETVYTPSIYEGKLAEYNPPAAIMCDVVDQESGEFIVKNTPLYPSEIEDYRKQGYYVDDMLINF